MKTARVVSFSFCNNQECPFNKIDSRHLIVCPKLVELERGNATAISYAWGEFERRPRWLGHFEDGETVTMTLGKEWDLGDLRIALDKLSHPHEVLSTVAPKCLWIDQLCIAQDDPEEVRRTLAQISEIYQKFNVVALLAGAPCNCWARRAELSKLSAGTSISEERRGSLFEELNNSACLSDLNLYPWVYRLWPRQEMLYAENIHIVWTQPDTVACPMRFQHFVEGQTQKLDHASDEDVNIVSRLWYERVVRGDLTADDLRSEAAKVQTGIEQTLTDWIVLKSYIVSTSAAEAQDRVFNFMNGEPLEAQNFASSRREAMAAAPDLRDTWEIARFLYQLSRVTFTPRKATKERDYVLAIWVDCPGYNIPTDYRQMSVRFLLKDALQQFTDHHGSIIGTHAPLGLFGFEGPNSHFWAPNMDQEKRKVDSVTDFYASMPTVPADFNLHTYVNPARGENDFSNAEELLFTVEKISTSFFVRFRWLVHALDIWTVYHYVARMLKDLYAQDHDLHLCSSTPIVADLLVSAAEASRLKRKFGTRREIPPGIKKLIGDRDPDDPVEPYLVAFHYVVETDVVDLDEVTRLLVSYALGMGYQMVREEGFQLVAQQSPPMLGLLCKDFKSGSEETFLRAFMTAPTWGDQPALLYQMVVRERQDGRKFCQVVGVWVPTNVGREYGHQKR